MPFKFKLKRTRRYNVSSKNSYVVCVHLLDNTLIECTLSADSTGQECLDSIAQRIELNETEYFGLRFVNKKLQLRWIDLEKPLKKQLDKYAHSPLLYFGVMFYVANAHKIKDEMTRYQYFLQLKTDVIDGKIPCTPEQAVLLASYSVQAEFGDHDYERHTQEYLKDFVLLPRNMTTDERTLADLTQEVSNAHTSLQGVPPATAESQYIIAAQQLDGYGMEWYPAKDEAGNELLLGASFLGIVVKHLNGQPTVCFKWSDINNVIHNKRMFGIETSHSEQTVHFQMDDPDFAKYVWKMCCRQHKFYRINEKSVICSGDDKEVSLDGGSQIGAIGAVPDIQQTVQTQIEIQEPQEPVQTVVYTHTPPCVHDPSQTIIMADNLSRHSQLSLEQTQLEMPLHNGSAYSLSSGDPAHLQQQAAMQHQLQQEQLILQNTQQGPSYAARLAMLPQYRPSPDYETVMRHRMERLAQQNLEQAHRVANISNAQVYSQPESMAHSQPEIGRSPPAYPQYLNHHARYINASVYANGFADVGANGNLQYRPVDRTSSLIIHPTYSIPELTSEGLPSHFSTSETMITEAMANHYKPPPPYPRNSSSSTPDLATQTARTNANSSPDLVSRKNFNNAALVAQSRLDQSMENLAVDTQNLHISQPPQQMPEQTVQQVQINSVQPVQPAHNIHDLSVNQSRLLYHMEAQPDLQNALSLAAAENISPAQIVLDIHGQPVFLSSEPTVRAGDNSLYVENVQAMTLNSESFDPYTHPATSAAEDGSTSRPSSSFVGLENPGFNEVDSENEETIECLDTSKVLSNRGSAQGHSKSSSLDNTSVHTSHTERSGSKTSAPPEEQENKRLSMGPLKMAALNGLTLSRGSVLEVLESDARAPKDERRRQLESKLEEGQVFMEFERIPKKRTTKCECSIAMQPGNRDRNRFKDVLPYDDNMVRISSRKDNPHGYINASNMKVRIAKEDWWYIAAQGPLPNTVVDFWYMVWEQEVEVIGMLTDLQEQGRQKCARYWPMKPGPQNKVKHGDFQIVMQFHNNSGCYLTSGLTVRHLPSGKERLVWHLQYTDWPDHGCPEDPHGFLAYLDEIESVRRMVYMERGDDKRTPVLVHCSAGVGRTGVLILSEIMKACLEYNDNTDLPTILRGMRQQRMFMVQTLSQYSFVYKILIQFLKNSRLI